MFNHSIISNWISRVFADRKWSSTSLSQSTPPISHNFDNTALQVKYLTPLYCICVSFSSSPPSRPYLIWASLRSTSHVSCIFFFEITFESVVNFLFLLALIVFLSPKGIGEGKNPSHKRECCPMLRVCRKCKFGWFRLRKAWIRVFVIAWMFGTCT